MKTVSHHCEMCGTRVEECCVEHPEATVLSILSERDTIPAPAPEGSELEDIVFALKVIDQLVGDTRNWGLQAQVRQHLQIILSSAEILAEGK